MELSKIHEPVHQLLPALVEGGPDHLEEKAFVLRLHRPVLPDRKAEHRALHIGPRHKGLRRHREHQLRLRIILHGQRERPVGFASGPADDALGDLFLHHHRHGFDRRAALKEGGQDRRRDVVGKIRRDLEGPPAVLLLRDPPQIRIQDILIADLDVVPAGKGLFEDRQKAPVDLHRQDPSGRVRQILGEGPDPGTDLQHEIILCDPGGLHGIEEHLFPDQEILPEFLPKSEIPGIQHRPAAGGICKIGFHRASFVIRS